MSYLSLIPSSCNPASISFWVYPLLKSNFIHLGISFNSILVIKGSNSKASPVGNNFFPPAAPATPGFPPPDRDWETP